MATTSLTKMQSSRRSGAEPYGAHMLYTSDKMAASAMTASSVHVNVFVDADPVDVGKWLSIVDSDTTTNTTRAGIKQTLDKTPVLEAMRAAFVDLFSHRLSREIDKVVDAYRVMLRESLAKGNDAGLQTALNRARLQEKVLASTSMADQAQACELLGLSGANPSATMKRKEEKRELLRFTVDGRAVYPLFQFDVEGRRVFPVIAKLIALKPEIWSDFRLLHWLTRPHVDFGAAPAEKLGSAEADVLDAFKREIVPTEHG